MSCSFLGGQCIFTKKKPTNHPSSWWLNQPIWKICSSNWKSSPSRGENSKNVWVATTSPCFHALHDCANFFGSTAPLASGQLHRISKVHAGLKALVFLQRHQWSSNSEGMKHHQPNKNQGKTKPKKFFRPKIFRDHLPPSSPQRPYFLTEGGGIAGIANPNNALL